MPGRCRLFRRSIIFNFASRVIYFRSNFTSPWRWTKEGELMNQKFTYKARRQFLSRARGILVDNELCWCTSNSFYGTLDGNFIWSRQLFRIRSVRLILLQHTLVLLSPKAAERISQNSFFPFFSSICLLVRI